MNLSGRRSSGRSSATGVANDPSQAFSAWDAHVRRRIRLVLASIPGQLDRRRWPGLSHRRRPTPDWIRLPIWLDRAWAEERGERLPRGALLEILWGQYALFLCLRIQDDLLDQTRDDLRLLLVADQFLLESLRAFHRLPGLDGDFWVLDQRCVRDTVSAAL